MKFNKVNDKLTNSKHGGGNLNKNASFGRKKTIKGIIIGGILGTIITGGLGVAAVTLSADQVKYTPSNEKFKATNVKEAMDEIYKLSEYKIPEDTYFYEQGTEGESSTIVRYKKINGEYYECDEKGIVAKDTTVTDVTSKTLIPYTGISAENISAGTAGYASNSFILGHGSNDDTTGVYYLGTGTNFNIATLLPNIDYTQLTEANFIAAGTGLNSFSSNFTNGFNQFWGDGYTITKNYDSTSGALTISGTSCSTWGKGNYVATATLSSTVAVYLVLGEIQSQ